MLFLDHLSAVLAVPQHLYDAFKQYSQGGGYLNSPSRELIASIDSGNKYPDAGAFDDQAQGMVKVTYKAVNGIPALIDLGTNLQGPVWLQGVQQLCIDLGVKTKKEAIAHCFTIQLWFCVMLSVL